MKKIPNIKMPRYHNRKSFIDSRFVRIISNDVFNVCMQYPNMNLKFAVEDCFVRKEVYEMLIKAASYLPKGYKIKVLDAWRPFELQKELYQLYSEKIIEKYKLSKESYIKQNEMIKQFVSEPIEDTNNPPVHTTGGAIDVTIETQDGKELDMGTSFDDFSEKTHTCYFENSKNKEIKNNRRLLYNAMIKAGFSNLPSEWWHYDYGDVFWAYFVNNEAKYKGVFNKEEIIYEELL